MVRRLFAAGLAPQAALGLIGDHGLAAAFALAGGPGTGTGSFERGAGAILAGVVSSVAGAPGNVQISALVRDGNAARLLLDAADGADLLVLGSHGYGGLEGAALGSVSQHCLRRATCPVVIIRELQAEQPPRSG